MKNENPGLRVQKERGLFVGCSFVEHHNVMDRFINVITSTLVIVTGYASPHCEPESRSSRCLEALPAATSAGHLGGSVCAAGRVALARISDAPANRSQSPPWIVAVIRLSTTSATLGSAARNSSN